MVEKYLNMGYCVYFDQSIFYPINWQTALLRAELFAKIANTIQKNYEKDREMATGEYEYARSGDISAFKWKDRGKKSAIVASSFHDASASVKVTRNNKNGQKEHVNCPESISDYNKYMSRVNRLDQ
ncbi:hypothetical protein HHI36_007792 [Cryptolaemus montrouzieri]|uniref:PiggyBac transposable element-derived protein domain-containing protein n=1 Tax=Cryptolaemus montrouzieri TaxID=559131 RepID=A0ABD2MQI1_9CUCU